MRFFTGAKGEEVRYREVSLRCHGLDWHKWRGYKGIVSGLRRCRRGVIRRFHAPLQPPPPPPRK